MRRLRAAALVLLVLILSACSWLPIYRLEINQGNYVTEDMVERLKLGMTRQQVRAALGTPLVADPFHADRWEYVYELRRKGRVVEHRQLNVFFVDDRLERWGGDEMPASAAMLNRAGASGAPLAPVEKSFMDSVRETLRW